MKYVLIFLTLIGHRRYILFVKIGPLDRRIIYVLAPLWYSWNMSAKQRMKVQNERAHNNITNRGNVPKSLVMTF